jgi:hypothetical protein
MARYDRQATEMQETKMPLALKRLVLYANAKDPCGNNIQVSSRGFRKAV